MMASPASAATVRAPIPAEDQSRANFYALLARLYAAGPDAALLDAIAAAEELYVETPDRTAHDLAQAWGVLKAASAAMDAGAAAQEHFDLFVGTGKSEVSPHAAAYLRSKTGSVLAELRGELAHLGLARTTATEVYEDHLAVVMETMRVLIAGAPGVEPHPLAAQNAFFFAYVGSWVISCCDAIIASPIANYYRRVAEFTKYFVAIERDSFAIE